MRSTLGVVLVSALALTGCGDDEPPATTSAQVEVDLRVVVQPQGHDGPTRERSVRCQTIGSGSQRCRDLRGLDARQLAPVPADVACAELYGGPALATVTGTIRGEPVAARFDLTDSCEIARWRRAAALLGEPPGNPPAVGESP